MSDNSIEASRSGDAFHYRWAARRCLPMLAPTSTLKSVIVEGSRMGNKAGEAVIDISEYYTIDGVSKIEYYQLKHSLKQVVKPFIISDLKDTISGFANRFSKHQTNGDLDNVSFCIVTNRPIGFKANIDSLAKDICKDTRFLNTIKGYTNLDSDNLQLFCQKLNLCDSEAEYITQKSLLKEELSNYSTLSINDSIVNQVIALIQNSFLDGRDREITQEVLLRTIGVGSHLELFPAPAKWTICNNKLHRAEYDSVIRQVKDQCKPIVIHATGGVGKSVFAQTFLASIDDGSAGVGYDCFGAGDYRNCSSMRHSHAVALTQISNEFSNMGLCKPMLDIANSNRNFIVKSFMSRLQEAICNLRHVNQSAKLYILIDAADNSMMIAEESNELCFVSDLIRENLPDGCCLICLCRSERRHLISNNEDVVEIELHPFSESESTVNLRSFYPLATLVEAAMFHRLTSGNPRVQSVLLNKEYASTAELTNSISSEGLTLDEQIGDQLNQAINKVKYSKTKIEASEIDNICFGLSCLPPNIPLDILAAVSDVDVNTIKSFICDLGSSLWITDTIVHFLDEPTETWFRAHYNLKLDLVAEYISALERLSTNSLYVALALPSLYLQSDRYDTLIQIALSDKCLPKSNTIEAKMVNEFRLKFALKAALRREDYRSAIFLAFKTSEVISGNSRRNQLRRDNIDIVSALMSNEAIENLAYSRGLKGDWIGSENIYTSYLLSGLEQCKGEAVMYYERARQYLNMQMNSKKHRSLVTEDELALLLLTKVNIDGVDAVQQHLSNKPSVYIFNFAKLLLHKFIDRGDIDSTMRFVRGVNDNHIFAIAAIDELLNVGLYPLKEDVYICLKYFYDEERPLPSNAESAMLSLVESALHYDCGKEEMLNIIRRYISSKCDPSIIRVYNSPDVGTVLRGATVQMVSDGNYDIRIESLILDDEYVDKTSSKYKQLARVITYLLPWYILRAQVIANENHILQPYPTEKSNSYNSYGKNDDHFLKSTLVEVKTSIAKLCNPKSIEIEAYYRDILSSTDFFYIDQRVDILRSVHRKEKSSISDEIHKSISDIINRDVFDLQQDIHSTYINLARAVFTESQIEASELYSRADDEVSKFGDEIILKLDTILTLIKSTIKNGGISDELAYRFLRCVEFVYHYTDSNVNIKDIVEILTKAAPNATIAAISRWRYRDSIYIGELYEPMVVSLLEMGYISSMTAWALSRFERETPSLYWLKKSLKAELNRDNRESIYKDFVSLTLKNSGKYGVWDEILRCGQEYNVDVSEVENIIAKIDKSNEQAVEEKLHKESDDYDWNAIFLDADLLSVSGVEELVSNFRSGTSSRFTGMDLLFVQAILRLTYDECWQFLQSLIKSDVFDIYYASDCLLEVKRRYSNNRYSFQKSWREIISIIGASQANRLSDKYQYSVFVSTMKLDDSEQTLLTENILNGLSKDIESDNSNRLFGFVHIATSKIEFDDTIDILNDVISQFESLLNNSNDDGEWCDIFDNKQLTIEESLANFIWIALGDPEQSVRWLASHVVKSLGQFECSDVITALIACDGFDAKGFNSYKFPFYTLSARLYLFVAYANIARNNAKILLPYKIYFEKHLSDPHILIRKYACDIVLILESAYAGTYSAEVLQLAKESTKSRFTKSNDDHVDSWWHKNKKVSTDHKFIFGWDFNNYWYSRLAEVFGIPTSQVEDLAAMVIREEFKSNFSGAAKEDPRLGRWDKDYNKTYHSHYDYPQTDTLHFYTCYHALMYVASMLLDNMAVVESIYEDYDDPFESWLNAYTISCDWIAETRTTLPLVRPKWCDERVISEEWLDRVEEIDLEEAIKENIDDELFVCVNGGWSEANSNYSESISVSTALVSFEGADSLFNALCECVDPSDFKLPDANEYGMEIDCLDLHLKGWLLKHYEYNEFETLDPYAANISTQSPSIESSILECLEKSEYFNLKSRNWSGYPYYTQKDPAQKGCCLMVSLPALQYLCKLKRCNLIFKVYARRYYQDPYNYKLSKHSNYRCCIYMMTPDGAIHKEQNMVEGAKNIINKLGLEYSVNTKLRWLIYHIYMLQSADDNTEAEQYLQEYDICVEDEFKSRRNNSESNINEAKAILRKRE